MRVSVLGLGKMGAPMARNLIEVGHEITLYDRNPDRTIELADKGGRSVATVAEAAKDAQVALTMVSDDEAVRALAYGPGGLLARLPPGAIHLCMSTIGVETSRALARAHAEAGQGYVAAPVFGRPGTAVSRQLWIMAGGPDIQVNRCLTLFDALGRGTTRVGPRAELAHALKLGGNLLTVLLVEGLGEVLTYGEKAGMPPAEYLRLLNTAVFKSPMVDTSGSLVVRRLHDPADLSLESALHDMRRTMEAAEELAAVMPAAEWLHRRLELAEAQGWGAQDLTVLSRSSRMAAGLEEDDSQPEPGQGGSHGATSTFLATSAEGGVELDLHKVTHFELIDDAVWAWTQGKRYGTSWKYLAEVQRTFSHTPFLHLDRHILLQPEAALARKPQSGEDPRVDAHQLVEALAPHPAPQRGQQAGEIDSQGKPPERKEPLELRKEGGGSDSQGRLSFAEGRRTLDGFFQRLVRPRVQPSTPPSGTPEHPFEGSPVNDDTRPSQPWVPIQEEAKALPRGEAQPIKVAPTEAGPPDLDGTTHFEVEGAAVWAWVKGRKTISTWRTLEEIEAACSHLVLVRIQRHILLNPGAVLSMKPALLGRSRILVPGDVELEVSRTATRRLKEVLGL